MVEEVRPIRAQRRRQGPGDQNSVRCRIRRGACDLRGQRRQLSSPCCETLLSEMKRHYRIAIRGDDARSALDESIMRAADEFRTFQQGESRPFRLAERGA